MSDFTNFSWVKNPAEPELRILQKQRSKRSVPQMLWKNWEAHLSLLFMIVTMTEHVYDHDCTHFHRQLSLRKSAIGLHCVAQRVDCSVEQKIWGSKFCRSNNFWHGLLYRVKVCKGWQADSMRMPTTPKLESETVGALHLCNILHLHPGHTLQTNWADGFLWGPSRRDIYKDWPLMCSDVADIWMSLRWRQTWEWLRLCWILHLHPLNAWP